MENEKNRVSVQIEGRNYVVITAENSDYVYKVAAEVTKGIRAAAQTARTMDTRDCAVMAALDFCDDRNKALKRNQDIIDKADAIIRQSADLNRSVKEYKSRLTEAINENTALTKRIRALEDQLRTVIRENEKLKKSADAKGADNEKKFEKKVQDKKTEKLMGYVPMTQASLFEDNNDNRQVNGNGGKKHNN